MIRPFRAVRRFAQCSRPPWTLALARAWLRKPKPKRAVIGERTTSGLFCAPLSACTSLPHSQTAARKCLCLSAAVAIRAAIASDRHHSFTVSARLPLHTHRWRTTFRCCTTCPPWPSTLLIFTATTCACECGSPRLNLFRRSGPQPHQYFESLVLSLYLSSVTGFISNQIIARGRPLPHKTDVCL